MTSTTKKQETLQILSNHQITVIMLILTNNLTTALIREHSRLQNAGHEPPDEGEKGATMPGAVGIGGDGGADDVVVR